MQEGKEQLTWRCTWRWVWRGWRTGRLMLFSPPLFSWCSSVCVFVLLCSLRVLGSEDEGEAGCAGFFSGCFSPVFALFASSSSCVPFVFFVFVSFCLRLFAL
jgi:hypothetical protein